MHTVNSLIISALLYIFFFFNDTATTEIYTLSLHDALPIFEAARRVKHGAVEEMVDHAEHVVFRDRKSTRLNSSHVSISYAVFCLKKKKKKKTQQSDNNNILCIQAINNNPHKVPRAITSPLH